MRANARALMARSACSGFHAFMTQPKRDQGRIHTCLQELHGAGVTQYVRRDLPVGQRRAVCARGRSMLADDGAYGGARKRGAPRTGEEGVGRLAARLGQPGPQDGDGLVGQRRDAFLPALTAATDMRGPSELDVLAGEAGEF